MFCLQCVSTLIRLSIQPLISSLAHSLAALHDGTGNVASKVDGVTMYQNGIAVQSKSALVRAVRNPAGPLQLVTMLTTVGPGLGTS